MKIILVFAFCMAFSVFSQDFTVEPITPLSPLVLETSGLLYLDDRIITHNDSGGEPWLYEIDSADGNVVRTVVIANASNIDWEELTMDETSIYICDFGNNAGTRTDLRVYKISIDDYLTTPNDTVYCDTISFNYSNQVDFTPAVYTTNFDAEAMIAKDDSLYIFTKNWGNYHTTVYALAKTPGEYSISPVDDFIVDCLVTGAAYDVEKNELLLTGYTLVDPILVFVKSFETNQFSAGTLLRVSPGIIGSIQIEGVTNLGNHQFFISSEKQGADASMLHLVSIENFIGLSEEITENRTIAALMRSDNIIVSGMNEGDHALIIDLNGQVCQQSINAQFSVEHLNAGLYILLVYDPFGYLIHKQKLVKI